MNQPTEFKKYRRSQIAEMRPYLSGEELSARVSITVADKEAGSPKEGDMVARNPVNHDDQWLVAAEYFAHNFESVQVTPLTLKYRTLIFDGNVRYDGEFDQWASEQEGDLCTRGGRQDRQCTFNLSNVKKPKRKVKKREKDRRAPERG